MTPEPIGTAGIECLHCHNVFRVNVYAAPASYLFHPPDIDGAVQVDEICEMTTAPPRPRLPRRRLKQENVMQENRIMPEAIRVYSVGLCFASVCTSASDADAAVLLNKEFPTGISNDWSVSTEDFADGLPNPSPCPGTAGHRHVLFDC